MSEHQKGPTCGNCKFARHLPEGAIECWGSPPTPVIMGSQKNLAGQAQLSIELLRPHLDPRTAACALWATPVLLGAETRQ